MSDNSSDSDSSCGWTVINHEGSEVEMVSSVTASGTSELSPECSSLEQEEQEVQVLQTEQGENSQNDILIMGETDRAAVEEIGSATEAEEEKSPVDNVYFGTASEDSDIVTLEPPKVEDSGNPEVSIVEEGQDSEGFNMGSSSSSQYTFCPPETVFSSQPSDDESSSDETSPAPSPAARRRRTRKKTVSASECEDQPPAAQEDPPQKPGERRPRGALPKCVALALLVALSVGFGHLYGTIQFQNHQQLVRKIHEDELNDLKAYLSQCQLEQDSFTDSKLLKENLARCWTVTDAKKMSFETQKKDLVAENENLRVSLEKEEKSLWMLQEELGELREQIRVLEDRGRSTEPGAESTELRQHLEQERQKASACLGQREALHAEAAALKDALERERLRASALSSELQRLRAAQARRGPEPQDKQVAALRERLAELEQKLTFEQQRSDLWERLYVETKDQKGAQETDGGRRGGSGGRRARAKPKETLLGTVKETFDAMKNSTKEFVRHHKEKIKQAKEAVKENLKKFSDSVKSTFRHFKDTTKNIFDEKSNKKFGAPREGAAGNPRTAFNDDAYPRYQAPAGRHGHRGPGRPRDGRQGKPVHSQEPRRNPDSEKHRAEQDCREGPPCRKACAGVPECTGAASPNPVDQVAPVRIDEFRWLVQTYLLQELRAFNHWKELDQFISKFFLNGVFAHGQKCFTDFVNDVKDYLKDMKEYQGDHDGAFEKLDGFIYRHVLAHTLPHPYGPSRPDKKQRMVNIENSRHRKRQQEHLQPQPCEREGSRR